MSRALVVVKLLALLAFLVLANDMRSIGDRIDHLIRTFSGYSGLLAFLFLWVVSIGALLATAFLPRLWLRCLLAAPILAGACVAVAYAIVSGVEVTYDSAAIMREAIFLTGQAVSFYAQPVLLGAGVALFGAIGLLLPLRPLRQGAVSVEPSAGGGSGRLR